MARVAAIQMCSGDEIEANLKIAGEYLQAAAEQGAEVAVLPECFALMPKNPQQLCDCAETHGEGMIQDFLARLAPRLGMWIIAGSLPLRSDVREQPFNTLLMYDARGVNVARYDKIHLFDVELPSGEKHCESHYTMPGERCVVHDTPLGVMGLSVCYDLRFPELYRKLSALGATCVVVPSAFTVSTGEAHWLTLLRARAIENSCYVIAAAQVGHHNSGRETFGHSLIIDPWGEVIGQRQSETGVLLAEVNSDTIQRIRKQLPSLSHRRVDLFS